MTAEKTREDRLRRAAARQGFTLRKSRRRDPRAIDFGVYWLFDQRTSLIVAGDPTYGGFTLDEVEQYLNGGQQ